jgi:hypothetical protein
MNDERQKPTTEQRLKLLVSLQRENPMSERCKHGKHSDNPCLECDEERGEAQSSLAQAPGSADAELVSHMHGFMDELNWFHAHNVKLHLNPTPTGWNIKFSIPKNAEVSGVEKTIYEANNGEG